MTDKKNGTLEAAVVEGESENLTFINTYGAGTGDEDIAAKIEASKKLTGRDMKANEFRFEIVTRAAENPEGFKETFAAAGTNTEAAEGAEGAVKFAGNDGALTYTTESLDQRTLMTSTDAEPMTQRSESALYSKLYDRRSSK